MHHFFSFPVVQSQNHVQLFATPWTAAGQASLSITVFQSLLKLMYLELVMVSNPLILCCPLLHLLSIFPSIGLSLDTERKEEYQVPPVDGSECGRGMGEGLLY